MLYIMRLLYLSQISYKCVYFISDTSSNPAHNYVKMMIIHRSIFGNILLVQVPTFVQSCILYVLAHTNTPILECIKIGNKNYYNISLSINNNNYVNDSIIYYSC